MIIYCSKETKIVNSLCFYFAELFEILSKTICCRWCPAF